jgi:hypothetical protein
MTAPELTQAVEVLLEDPTMARPSILEYTRPYGTNE